MTKLYVKCKHVRGERRCAEDEYWDLAAPFVCNPSARLIHRVRSVHTHNGLVNPGRLIINYWCGGRHYRGHEDDLLFDFPENRILCQRCECAAQIDGEKTAHEIVGEHIHVGGLVLRQSCCGGRIIELDD